MSCSIYHDNFQIFMEEKETKLRMNLAGKGTEGNFRNYYGTAMQNPDLKRVELATMLRDAERVQSTKSRKKFEQSMAAYVVQSANCNQHGDIA